MSIRHRRAFTLIELLVVIGIIGVLVSLVLPALAAARSTAQGATCLANLHSLALAGDMYLNDHAGYYWPATVANHPAPGVRSYFWGSNTLPVNRRASWLLGYVDHQLEALWCPLLPWGSYVPQGVVNEPTTTYGYNAWCLDPFFWGRRDLAGQLMPRKRITDITRPNDLFVFADAAMAWRPAGISVFQNSASLDPVDLGAWGPNRTPTTHFRHHGTTHALCADGHAAPFGLEGGRMVEPAFNLGFVGPRNDPHYDQP